MAVASFAGLAACSPTRQYQEALHPVASSQPRFDPEANRFVSFDGAALGLSVWPAAGEPDIVVVGVHGMNDYGNAFHMAAPWWAARGVTTYAYDQRGFGRSPHRGRWPEEELMRSDLRAAVQAARARHPDAVLAVVGISMGGAVVMSAFGSDDPPEGVDRVILSGPGLRGWGALPALYRASLWASARVRPGWVVRPPRRVARTIRATDNDAVLRLNWEDPLFLKTNRIDQVYGVVSLMERAHERAGDLPPNTFLLYGAKDEVIPPAGMARTATELPSHVRTAFYENGYHMLMRDLQAEVVWADQLAFMRDPNGELPSGSPPLPWGPEARLTSLAAER